MSGRRPIVLSVSLNPAVSAALALALAGCASGFESIATGPLAYQHANLISQAGYSESQIGPDRYRVRVKGPANTPRERMEKIAATRAAEIGKDNKLGYFKVESVEHKTECETFKPGPKAPGSTSAPKTLAYAVTTADVSYAKSPPDPTYLEARTSFDQFRAELDQDRAPPPPVDPATLRCG